MFNKKVDNKITSSMPSLIAPNTIVEGQINCEGELQLDGKVIGDLTVKTLIIGQHGTIEGNITAHEVQVKGTVNGCINADVVTLEASANVHGDVLHDTLTIQAGALLEGQLTHKEEVTNITPLVDQTNAM